MTERQKWIARLVIVIAIPMLLLYFKEHNRPLEHFLGDAEAAARQQIVSSDAVREIAGEPKSLSGIAHYQDSVDGNLAFGLVENLSTVKGDFKIDLRIVLKDGGWHIWDMGVVDASGHRSALVVQGRRASPP